MQYFFITVFILVYLYCFHFSNHHLLLCNFPFFSMKFFCFQIGEPVHEERDAPSLTAPSPHPPMFDKSPHSLDKSYPVFDATPHLTIEILNPQMVLVASVSICLIGSLGMICQVSSAKSMKLRDQQMIKVEFVNH